MQRTNNTPLVTIIVPVYNAEKSVHRALDSLKSQSYSHLEIIIINDCSTDGSMELIRHYAAQLQARPQVKVRVCEHAQNKGVAAARNTGLAHATGEYVFHVDADDWIEEDAIELLVAQALETNAEVIGFNWWLTFNQRERKMKQPAFTDSWQAIEWMLIGKMRWNLWMFFVKRQLYEKNALRFLPDMNMGEDMLVMIKLLTYAQRVCYLDEALYHYCQSNENSLTTVYSDSHMQQAGRNLEEVESFLLASKFGDKAEAFIHQLKLTIKLPLLISNKRSQYDRWFSWFPEANASAMANPEVSLRIRLLQWAAANRQHWLLRLHYYFVIRLVYGIIYK